MTKYYTYKGMLRRFNQGICSACNSWGGHYEEDEYRNRTWESCIFCTFGKVGWHAMKYQGVVREAELCYTKDI